MTATHWSELHHSVTQDVVDRLVARVDVPSERPRIAVMAPFTELMVADVPEASAADAVAAVTRACAAQPGWAAVPVEERARVLFRFHDLLLETADLAMDIVQLEGGKARIPAFEEVYDTIATARYYARTGPRLLRRRRRAVSLPGFTTAYEYRHPHGVVVSITPWNFPFTLAISDILPALLAGNTVVLKPDEKTPLSALFGVLLLGEAGIPRDVIQVVTGYGEEIGDALIEHADFINFIGSTAVGRSVASRAAGKLIGSSMELGGKNAAIILADSDLDRAMPGISRAVFSNGGQLCISMERIYVDHRIKDEFIARFVDHTRQLAMTPEFDFSSTMSSMITREHLESVHAHVEDAVAKGATLLTGGKPRPDIGPLFYDPTVLTDVDETMMLCRAETFGPVVSVYGFRDVAEAVALVNESDLGLNHSVWTRDTRRGVEVAAGLQAGSVGVNDGYAAVWSSYDAPMGGMKSSGLARRHGSIGLLKFTEPQTVAVQRVIPAFAPPPGLSYPGYQRILGPLLRMLKRLPFYK